MFRTRKPIFKSSRPCVFRRCHWLLAFSPLAAAQGVLDTPHNMERFSPGAADASPDWQQVCIYCHTPSNADAAVSSLKWRKAPAEGTQDSGTSRSFETGNSESAIGLGSFLCLGCHDGVQASDRTSGTNASTAHSVSGPGPEHPVGIPYGNPDPSTTTPAEISSTRDFASASFAKINSEPSWWIDTGRIDGTRNKSDILLYARAGLLEDGTKTPYVECASCHDPHTNENGNFLRLSNDHSAVCQSCHNR